MMARYKPSRRASACGSVDYSYRGTMQPTTVAEATAAGTTTDTSITTTVHSDSTPPLYNPTTKYASPYSPISVVENGPAFLLAI